MPRPVYPVVKLPYDRPATVVRVLDNIKKELQKASKAARHRVALVPAHFAAIDSPSTDANTNNTMTARVAREPERLVAEPAAYVDQQTVDQVTVGVRECTITPKARPEIRVTPGVTPCSNTYIERFLPSSAGPFLHVPPSNITAEIRRPPLEQSLLSSMFTALLRAVCNVVRSTAVCKTKIENMSKTALMMEVEGLLKR